LMLGEMKQQSGIVYLVGAGPGDPGLITWKGHQLLTQADVVIYDHLVSPRLLELCRPGTTIIYAGKEQRRHTKSQADINRLLVRFAKSGKCVVRLKGGDPFLFGRGGEEMLALRRARIPVEVVPGVTSALAVPAYAGIPVTHRQLASSVAIVTGHEDPEKSTSAIRWDQLATATDTIVCLMGVGTLAEMVSQLRRHGRPARTPCAVIEWGTWARQRTATGTLATIAQRCRAARIAPPAVIVIGDVVTLREHLRWFESKPLLGKRIVVTRPTDRADELAATLERFGAEVVRLPAIELAPMAANGAFHQAVEHLNEFDWVFFTSPEGIQWFRRLLAKERKDLRILSGRHIGAIGPKTSDSIERLGIHVDFLPQSYSQDGMVEGLKRRRVSGKRALILSAKDSRDVLGRGLSAQGMTVTKVPIYQTLMPASLVSRVRDVFQEPVDYVTVTSASCVEHVVQALRAGGLARRIPRLKFASIGPVTSAAVRAAGGRVAVEANTSTVEGVVEALLNAARTQGKRHGGISHRATATTQTA